MFRLRPVRRLGILNPRTYNPLPPLPPSLTSFFKFLLDDKTLAPDVLSSCSFIPRAHFETSLKMVSYMIYDVSYMIYDVISSRLSRHFWVKMHVLSTFFNSKSKTCQWNDAKGLLCVILHPKHRKLPFIAILTWFLILGEIQDGDHCWWRHRPPAAPPPIKNKPHLVE